MAKARRAANGDGSLYKRKSDGLWVGAVSLPDGGRKPVYGKTRTEAKNKKQELEERIRKSLPVPTGKAESLGVYLAGWLEHTVAHRVRIKKLSPATARIYRQQVRLHITPYLGKVVPEKLSPRDVRLWMDKLLDSGLAPGTVILAHSVLRKALADAVREELLFRNVACLVDTPDSAPRREAALTEEEAVLLLEVIGKHPFRAIWIMLMATGLRRGEVLSLRWSDIDFEAREARVGPSIQRVRDDEPDPRTGRYRTSLQRTRGKTEDSDAWLSLPDIAVEDLQRHRARQAEQRLAAKVWTDPDLCFTSPTGGFIDPQYLLKSWYAVCERAGVRQCSIRTLRRTAATWLYEADVDLKAIQALLRHSRLSTTSDIYTDVRRPVTRRTADTMNGLLKKLG